MVLPNMFQEVVVYRMDICQLRKCMSVSFFGMARWVLPFYSEAFHNLSWNLPFYRMLMIALTTVVGVALEKSCSILTKSDHICCKHLQVESNILAYISCFCGVALFLRQRWDGSQQNCTLESAWSGFVHGKGNGLCMSWTLLAIRKE